MNTKQKHALGISSIVLTATLAFGSIASAAGNGNGNGDGDGIGGRRSDRPQLTTEQKCDRQEQITERVAKVQQRIADRLDALEDRQAAAEADGDDELMAKLDQRIVRLETLRQRVETRYAKYTTWVGEHC